jgi:hypothetical protein
VPLVPPAALHSGCGGAASSARLSSVRSWPRSRAFSPASTSSSVSSTFCRARSSRRRPLAVITTSRARRSRCEGRRLANYSDPEIRQMIKDLHQHRTRRPRCACSRSSFRALRPQRITLWMLDRVDREVDVERRPVEMRGAGRSSRTIASTGALLNHGKSSNGRKSSRPSNRSQKPHLQGLLSQRDTADRYRSQLLPACCRRRAGSDRENTPFAGISCAQGDSNSHGGFPPQGPQPCASTNSATGACAVADYRHGPAIRPRP